MTEIPEHLLARSRARRAAMGGGGDDAAPASSTPATTTSDAPVEAAAAAPAVAAVAAVPATPDPVPPWVEAAETRQKIPAWAVPVLALLPLWAIMYALTLDTPTPTEPGPFEAGAAIYNDGGCAGCHGATGGGAGAVPALTGADNVNVIFTSPADQITWVALGTSGYRAQGLDAYGTDDAKQMSPSAQMPGWIDSLSAAELMEVVLHERSVLNDEEFDAEVWEDGWEEKLSALLPADKVTELTEILEEWKADPPVAP